MRPDREVEREGFDRVDSENGEGRWVLERVVELMENVEFASMEEPVLPVEKGITCKKGHHYF